MKIDHVKARRSATKMLKATGALQQIVAQPKKKLSPAQQRRIVALSQQITGAHKDLAFALSGTKPPSQAVFGARIKGVPKSDFALADTQPGGDGKPVQSNFDDFFSAVASSFANAQQNLDNRTKEYLAGIQGQNEFMPTAFRISKVSADMKFAVESVDAKSVGVIFYKDTSSTDK